VADPDEEPKPPAAEVPADPADPAAFFAGHPDAYRVYEAVHAIVQTFGPADVHTSRSQVAFRRRRGFAYLWLPGRWLTHPAAEVVLSIALPLEDESRRWKEVVHPSPSVWMHHLEIASLEDVDDEVRRWLREAFDAAMKDSTTPVRHSR
jgi:hypothetical protein